MNEFKLIDRAQIEFHYQGNEDILADIAVRLIEQINSDYQELYRCFREKDFEGLSILSHRLKGACSNFFAPTIVDKLYQIETLSKNGEGAKTGPLLSELESLIEIFKNDLMLIGEQKAA